jgi:hypothetical protein
MNPYERLLAPENLNYAWIKAKNLYRMVDGFVDTGEIASFELDLEQRLLDIRRQFEKGRYRLAKLRPLPRPKKISAEKPVDRQYYHVAIDDQVAWIAVVNALGPELDMRMEPWSYGNRLYRPAWYEKDEESKSTLEIGPYRHASGHLYRKFQHSWPLFRRHVALTARMMVLRRKLLVDELDDPEQRAAITAEHANLAYFREGFWPKHADIATRNDLYHASIDLKQFYPDLNIEAVLRGLDHAGALADPRMTGLVKSMLNFQIDMAGTPDTALENVEPPFLKGSIKGLPTGLFVSGFLANAAMLPIDAAVAQKVEAQHNVAHFRFVDDHTVIAYDFDTLCDWLLWYEQLLHAQGIGPGVNVEKFDPPALGEWIQLLKSVTPIVELGTKNEKTRDLAIRETRIDGKNPTKLMTKTLAQVSAIAAADIHILDDEDLNERLNMLEWLLLADIPEREIRPDTRAAFAAGQIASLVPVLIQEADGLVDAARDVAVLERLRPTPGRSTEDELLAFEEQLRALKQKRDQCIDRHSLNEQALLGRCFALLLQSLREYPGKARLFYRAHQYCRLTGHHGLTAIADWLKEVRELGHSAWADYYVALSLQIMASGLLAAARRITAPDALHSDIEAAANHLKDVARLDKATFRVPPERETWYHAAGRKEFGVALIQVGEVLKDRPEHAALAQQLVRMSQNYVSVLPRAPVEIWLRVTGRTSGVWAHLAEDSIAGERGPSPAWTAMSPHFAFDQRSDWLAARRYPELFPATGWAHLLAAVDPLPANDSAWLSEVIGQDESRREAANATGKIAFTRAARSLDPPSEKCITINEWVKSVHACNAFDPRRGEWTALEIAAQLLEDATAAGNDEAILDRLHPNNVLLPKVWVDRFPCHRHATELSWEEWRNFVRPDSGTIARARLRESATSLFDYRYEMEGKAGICIPNSERRLISVGRLILGLLRNDHAAPRIWNMRGNELVFPLPKARWFEALAISSPTTMILEACLGARSAETRTITRQPALFGWLDGEHPNDASFDPPPIYGMTDLLKSIRHAQRILEANQLAVARNQPRQLIPFRLCDFAAGAEAADANDDGGHDGQ